MPLGHVEIRTPEDAHSMIELAQKLIQLRDTIDVDSDGNQKERRSAQQDTPITLGSFRDQVIEGGSAPGERDVLSGLSSSRFFA